MKKKLKLLVGYLTVVALVFGLSIDTVKAVTNYTNDPALDPYDQVVYAGGTEDSKWSSDGVSVSKTIEGAGTEDYFDITLQVKTKKSVKEIMESDSALVVFVLDLSETMNAAVNGGTITASNPKKITSTVNQVKNFVSTYKSNSADYPNNELGVVGYNSDGKDLVARQKVKNLNLSTFNNSLTTAVNNVVNASGYATASNRFTNMHAGLLKAQAMLDASNAKYKYVVFLTDGMPTTYSNSGTTGINTSTLKDQINGNRTLVAGNYSDTGAIKAREVAMTLKSQGVKIYSVGVGLKTFVPWTNADYTWVPYMYQRDSNNALLKDKNGNYVPYTSLNGEQFVVHQIARGVAVASTVENKLGDVTGGQKGKSVWEEHRDTIQQKPWEFAKIYSGYTNYVWTSSMAEPSHTNLSRSYSTSSGRNLFGRWLQYGIGSGKYFEINNTAGFDNLASDIQSYLDNDLLQKRTDLFTTSDPLSTSGNTLSEYIEFRGFYKVNGILQPVSTTSLTGSSTSGGENTATFTTSTTYPSGIINWDLKNSGYTLSNGVYTYKLKYRVRLKTDKQGFVNEKAYETNGTTSLKYVVETNGQTSGVKTINYPIPKVKGYLTELKITKLVEGIAPNKTLNSANANFEFTVTFKRNNQDVGNTFTYDKYNANGNKVGNTTNITNGGKITLQNGQYAVIHGLFHDINYTVAETNKDGFVKTIQSGSETGTTHTEVKLNQVTYKNKAYYLNMLKVDDKTGTALEGVRFSIYKTRNADGSFSDIVSSMNEGMSLQDMMTNVSGVIEFGNLPFTYGGSSTYYLVEEETIDKYNLLDNYVILTVNGSGITATYNGEPMSLGNDGVTITVPNAKGIDLPETGGIGETLFEVLGILFMLFSSVLYTLNKKAKNNN